MGRGRGAPSCPQMLWVWGRKWGRFFLSSLKKSPSYSVLVPLGGEELKRAV